MKLGSEKHSNFKLNDNCSPKKKFLDKTIAYNQRYLNFSGSDVETSPEE